MQAKKKEKLKKFLLYYRYRADSETLHDWAKINAAKQPDYKTATTLLKSKLTREEKTTGREKIEVIHLYNILV